MIGTLSPSSPKLNIAKSVLCIFFFFLLCFSLFSRTRFVVTHVATNGCEEKEKRSYQRSRGRSQERFFERPRADHRLVIERIFQDFHSNDLPSAKRRTCRFSEKATFTFLDPRGIRRHTNLLEQKLATASGH